MDTINLDISHLNAGANPNHISFVRVEIARYQHIPIAVVWYRRGTNRRECGARLDLDKRAFLEHFSEPSVEELFRSNADRIVEKVYSQPRPEPVASAAR